MNRGVYQLDLYYIKYKDLPSDEDIRVFITELFKQVHGDLAHSMEVLQKFLLENITSVVLIK